MSRKPPDKVVPRIYLCSRYARYREMQDIAARLRAEDFEIVSGWIMGNHTILTKARTRDEYNMSARFLAQDDLRDLNRAQMLLYVGDKPGGSHEGGGRWFEMGYAHALDIPVVCVGEPEIIFQYLPGIHVVANIDDFISEYGSRTMRESFREEP